jgi:hypothetical protein
MTTSLNSGTLNITATASAPKHNVTTISGASGAGGAATLGTVGAGKVWRVISIQINAIKAGASTGSLVVSCGGVAACTIGLYSGAALVNSQTSHVSLSYSDAINITAGQTISINNTSCDYFGYSIAYIEEAA